MTYLIARVKNGRLVLDEPTELPEGTEVELGIVVEDFDDDIDEEDRAALYAALAASRNDFATVKGVSAADLIAELRRG